MPNIQNLLTMKKVYLLAFYFIICATVSHAQLDAEAAYLPLTKLDHANRSDGFRAAHRDPGEFLACDDFSDSENWLTYGLDGTSPTWQVVTTEPSDLDGYIDPMASATEGNGFGAFNGVQYILSGSVPPQNAVLEYDAFIDCSGAAAVTLRFEQAYRAFNNDRTFVEVTAGDWETDPILSVELNTTVPTNGPTVQELVLLDITEIAAGEANVRVRFRWEELEGDDDFGAGYAWYVDDLCVQESWNYDQELSRAFHRSGQGRWMENGMEYYQIPTDQLTEINFFGETQNMGALEHTGAKLNMNISGAGSFTGTSSTVDLGVGESAALTITETFTPDAFGEYNLTYFVNADNAEEETVNDTLQDVLTVTPCTYSRDNGLSTSSLSNTVANDGNPLLIGNVFDIFGDEVVAGVDIAVTSSSTNVGQVIFGQIMIFDPGSGSFVYAGQTPDHVIDSEENGGFIHLFFEEEVALSAGQTVLVLAGHYGGGTEVEFRMAQPVEEQTVLGLASGETEPFFLSNPSAMMVRLLSLECFIGMDETDALNHSVGFNQPNPFTQSSVIPYELSADAQVVVEVTDLSGKQVLLVDQGWQSAGAHSLEIDGSQLENGIYFYTFRIGTSKITRKMIVSR